MHVHRKQRIDFNPQNFWPNCQYLPNRKKAAKKLSMLFKRLKLKNCEKATKFEKENILPALDFYSVASKQVFNFFGAFFQKT